MNQCLGRTHMLLYIYMKYRYCRNKSFDQNNACFFQKSLTETEIWMAKNLETVIDCKFWNPWIYCVSKRRCQHIRWHVIFFQALVFKVLKSTILWKSVLKIRIFYLENNFGISSIKVFRFIGKSGLLVWDHRMMPLCRTLCPLRHCKTCDRVERLDWSLVRMVGREEGLRRDWDI